MKKLILVLLVMMVSLLMTIPNVFAQELVCIQANGLVWCYNDQECGQACNDVCETIGAEPIADNNIWFEAQNTQEECAAISQAFGLGDIVSLNDFGFGCLEDVAGDHSVGSGLNPSLLCSTNSACPEAHRTGMDGLGEPCGPNSRRSICPCGLPAVPNFMPPSNVPTLSQWGLIAMAFILGVVGFMVARRRKVED